MISELDTGIANSISGLALIAFWKRALHIYSTSKQSTDKYKIDFWLSSVMQQYLLLSNVK